MKRITVCVLFLSLITQMLPSYAATKVSRSAGFSSSKGYAVRSSPVRTQSSASSGAKPSPQYRNIRPIQGEAGSSPGRNFAKSSSILNRSSTQPSPALQKVIREKESSGPGWIGTGLLVWLLSQHDMSSSDKEWIQDRIAEAKENDEVMPAAPSPLSDIVFNWSLPADFHQGKMSEMSVTASAGSDTFAPECQLKTIKSISNGKRAVLTWTPGNEVSAVVTCNARGFIDQRLLRVGSAANGN